MHAWVDQDRDSKFISEISKNVLGNRNLKYSNAQNVKTTGRHTDSLDRFVSVLFRITVLN